MCGDTGQHASRDTVNISTGEKRVPEARGSRVWERTGRRRQAEKKEDAVK
jgi:hypothetical protein